jgi:UDP-glucose 4-epimerase
MGHISLILAGDTDKIVPKNTYGMTKACGELFINDYTRKEGKWGLVLSEAS